MNVKRGLLIGVVALSTAVLLTGCGKKENKIKNYEKELEKTLNNVAAQIENEVNSLENQIDTTNTTNNATSSSSTTNQNGFEISFRSEEYTTQDKEGKTVFYNKRNIPTVKNLANSAAATKIENSLREISDKNWNELTKSANEYTEGGMKAYDTPYGVSYVMKTAANNSKVVTIEANQSGSMGGVSWTAREFYTYDAQSGELLTIGTMAKNETELKNALREIIKNYVNNNFSYIQNDVDKSIDEILNQNGNYGILDDQFVVVLPKYSFGSGADGVKTVEISKGVINSYLAEKYQL